MEIKIIAKCLKGCEYMYNAKTAHKVSKNNAEKILTVLNTVNWQLNDGEVWHTYEINEYDFAYGYAFSQKYIVRKGIVKEIRE